MQFDDEARREVADILGQLDNLAQVWGDEGVFRRCRDRLRKLTEKPATDWVADAAAVIVERITSNALIRVAESHRGPLGGQPAMTLQEGMQKHIAAIIRGHIEGEDPPCCETCEGTGKVTVRSDIIVDMGVRPRESDYEYLIEDCPHCSEESR
jgi:hypothetical protein